MSKVLGWLASFPLTVVLAASIVAASIIGSFVGAEDAGIAFRTLVHAGWYVALIALLGLNIAAALAAHLPRAISALRNRSLPWRKRLDPLAADFLRAAILLLLAGLLVSGCGTSGTFHVTQADLGTTIDLPSIPMGVQIRAMSSSNLMSGAEIELMLVDRNADLHPVTFSSADLAPVVVAGVQLLLVSARADFDLAGLAVRWEPQSSGTSYLKNLHVGEMFVLAHSELTAVLEQVIPGIRSSNGEILDPPTAILRIRGIAASGTELDLTRPIALDANVSPQSLDLASGTLNILDLDVPTEFAFSYVRSPEQPLVWAGVILLLLSLLAWLVLHPQPRPNRLRRSPRTGDEGRP